MLRKRHARNLHIGCCLVLSSWTFSADNTEQRVDQIFSAYQRADFPGCGL
jgi:hypothetical protein